MTIEIRLTGVNAEEARETAIEVLELASSTAPQVRRQEYEEQAAKGDPVAIAALILSIPCAIVASMDLIERAKLVERVRDLRNRLEETAAKAYLIYRGKPPLDLANSTIDQVIDWLSRYSNPRR